VLLLWLIREKKQPASSLPKGNFFSFFRYWPVAGAAYKKLVTGLLLFALFNSSDVFLLLKTREITGNDSMTIAAYIFYNLVYATASYPLGSIADKFGMRKVFIGGLFLFAIVYTGFAFEPSTAMIFVLFFIYGIFSAATEGISKAWITNIAHGNNTATAIGFYTSCESICALLASAVAGFLWADYGSRLTFLLTASATLVVVVIFSRIKNAAT
jgi:MFS family permease